MESNRGCSYPTMSAMLLGRACRSFARSRFLNWSKCFFGAGVGTYRGVDHPRSRPGCSTTLLENELVEVPPLSQEQHVEGTKILPQKRESEHIAQYV